MNPCPSKQQCKQTVTVPADGIDNDCDGQIDEERLDGKDNDGDGLIDEDLKKVWSRSRENVL